ncbi:WD40 repeat domain-containing protein [Streptomyces sp. M-16]|uniref:WD40 repeat domain-containing protein n=1 Tax=Streptomyces sp. M-16 TaxID=3233040 RepID=UPI003F97AA0D
MKAGRIGDAAREVPQTLQEALEPVTGVAQVALDNCARPGPTRSGPARDPPRPGGPGRLPLPGSGTVQETRRTLDQYAALVNAVAFSPDGKTLATGSGDRTARLWDTDRGVARTTLLGHTEEVYSVAFHPHDAVSPRPAAITRHGCGTPALAKPTPS